MSRRPSVTLAPILAGARVHIGLTYEDDRVVDIRIDQHRVGSYGREVHTALASLASLALRHGARAHDVAELLRGTEGGPDGRVEDCDGVTSALSVADLVGQILVHDSITKTTARG